MLAEPSSAAVSVLVGELPQPEHKLVPQLWIASTMLAQQLTVFFATWEEVANCYALCWGEQLAQDGRGASICFIHCMSAYQHALQKEFALRGGEATYDEFVEWKLKARCLTVFH